MGSLCGPWCANQLKGCKGQGSKSHSLGVCALQSPEGREGYWCARVDGEWMGARRSRGSCSFF